MWKTSESVSVVISILSNEDQNELTLVSLNIHCFNFKAVFRKSTSTLTGIKKICACTFSANIEVEIQVQFVLFIPIYSTSVTPIKQTA